jgi:leucyl/phenylalanyl-tRNA--protein transferase
MARMRLTLTAEGLEMAYSRGIFPMASSPSSRVTWHRPDPRAVIPIGGMHVSRSLSKEIRRGMFEVRINTAFEEVMRACADRPEGTWISEEFVRAYGELHRQGKAHSVETWREGRLVGGLYGVALGGAFMAESMFHRETNASKVALAALMDRLSSRGFVLMDVQYLTPHLATLGAVEVPAYVYDGVLRVALGLERSLF